MAKKKKSKSNKGEKKRIEVDVEPDPKSSDYFYDEVDQFHMDQENILLSKGAQIRDSSHALRVNEEVLGVASDSSDDDERIEMYESRLKKLRGTVNIDGLGSDLEEDIEDQKKKDDEDNESSGLEELDDDQLEEKEALKLQKELVGEMDEDDFGLVALQKSHKEESGDLEKIERNIEGMKQSEKLEMLQQESPELMMLIEELKQRMEWSKKKMAKQAELSKMEKLELRLCLDYCVTLNFYLYLKLRREDITNHPVIERIRFYNEAFKSLNLGKKVKPLKSFLDDDSIMQAVKNSEDGEMQKDEEEEEEDGRRAINKTIEKNRGLTPIRKKENKNPRVKHRKKFQKALKRRTGQVRPVRREIAPYQGEISGIRSGIKKGIKFK